MISYILLPVVYDVALSSLRARLGGGGGGDCRVDLVECDVKLRL